MVNKNPGYYRRCIDLRDFYEEPDNNMTPSAYQERTKEARKAFVAAIMERGYHSARTSKKKADLLGVSPSAIDKWEAMVPMDVWEKALESCRKDVARDCIEVDEALKEDAKEKGADAKTRELFYRIFMGYTPQQSFELSRGKDKLYEGMSQADLLREAIKGLPEEERKKLVEEAMGGVVEAQEVDSTAIGDGGSGVVAKE